MYGDNTSKNSEDNILPREDTINIPKPKAIEKLITLGTFFTITDINIPTVKKKSWNSAIEDKKTITLNISGSSLPLYNANANSEAIHIAAFVIVKLKNAALNFETYIFLQPRILETVIKKLNILIEYFFVR